MKKLLSTTIAGLLLVLVTSTSLAYPHIDEALPSGVLTVYANAAMLYKSQPESREASIKADIVIKSNDISKVEVCIKPLNKVKIPELTFKGNLLPIMGNGYYDERMVLGEFSSFNNGYALSFFKIESKASAAHLTTRKDLVGSCVVTLVIENTSSGEIYLYEQPIAEKQFNSILQYAKLYYSSLGAKNDVGKEEAYNLRVINAYQINHNWHSSKNQASSPRAGGSLTIESGVTYGGHKSASYNQLSNMLTSLNNDGSVNLASNTTMRDVVSQTGWKRYNSLSNKYMYVMYGSAQPSGAVIVQMSLISWSGNNGNTLSSYVGVDNAAMFEYDPSTKTATLLYYGWGINLKNCYVGVGNLAGSQTFFLSTLTTFSLQNGSNPYNKILWSKILPGGSTTYDVLSSLVKSSLYDSNWGKSFPQDLESQLRMDNNERKLVKDVGTHSGNNYLCSPGNYLCVTASYSGTYSSHKAVFKFTCTNNL